MAKAKQAAGGHHLYDTVAGNAVVGALLGPKRIDFLDGLGERHALQHRPAVR